MTKTTKTANREPKSWKQMQEEQAAFEAANQQAIRTHIAKLGFKKKLKWGDRDCWDCGSLWVAFFADDNRCELYAFDGAVGSVLAYEINLSFGVPAQVSIATINAAVAAAK